MSGVTRTPRVGFRAPMPGIAASLIIILAVAAVIGLSSRPNGGSSTIATPGASDAPMTTLTLTATVAPTVDQSFTVTVEPGLAVRWSAEAAATRVLSLIASNEKRVGRSVAPPRILSVDAFSGNDAPDEVGGSNLGEFPVVWIVHATGTFTNDYGPVTVEPGAEGWYVFDDTGEVVGSGFGSP